MFSKRSNQPRKAAASTVVVRLCGIEVTGQRETREQALRDVLRQMPAEEERITLTPAGWAAAYRAKGTA